MRKLFLFSVLFLLFSFFSAVKGENEIAHDYIASGYFQLIYKADIAYLEGNYDLAFALLQEAEKRVPLINQRVYREIELYIWLLTKNGQYDKAIYYMEHLAVNYGQHPFGITFRFYNNPDVKNRFIENNPDFFETTLLEIWEKSESFYTPGRLELIQLLTEMTYNDQRVRTLSEGQEVLDFEKMLQADSINKVKFLEIVEKYGFPNERLLGSRDFRLHTGIDAMIVHFSDDKEIQELLLHFVRMGKASPSLYGFFVDRRMAHQRKQRIFGAATNVTDDRIYDVENVDKRRLAIGMPTREQERRRRELIAERRR